MYQGKRQRRRKNNRPMIVLAVLLVMLSLTIGSTLAYLTAEDEEIVNTFTPSKITTTVDEELDGEVKRNVRIQNTGDTEAYIRAAVIITWQNDLGEVLGTAPAATDYVIDWGSSNWDTLTSDGFYYYKLPVAAGTYTDMLYDSITLSEEATIPDGYSLNVEIVASGIQSKPTSVVIEQWMVTLDADGKTISKN